MPSEEPKEKQKVRGKDYFNQVINYAIESAKKAKEASQKESDTEKPNISKIVDSSLASSPESVVYFIRELVNSLYRIGDQARDLFPEVITSVSRAHNDIQSGNLSSYAILHNLLRSNVRLNYFDESIIQPTLDKIAQAQGPEDYHDFVFQFNDDIKQREDSQYLLALDNMVVIANQLPSLGQLDSKSKPTFKLPTIKMDHVDFVGQLKEKAKEKGEMDFNLNGSGVQYITDFATAVYLGDPDYVVESNDPDSLLANYQQLVPTVLEKLSNPALVALTLLETRHHAYESLKKVESDGLLPYRLQYLESYCKMEEDKLATLPKGLKLWTILQLNLKILSLNLKDIHQISTLLLQKKL